MSLNDSDRATLVALYADKAKRTMHEAYIAIDAESWGMAANRLYYALFHAVSSMFIYDGIAVGSHRGIKSKFGEYYVLTKKFTIDDAKVIAQMETLRDKADYNIMFVASEKDILPYVEKIESFIQSIDKYIKT